MKKSFIEPKILQGTRDFLPKDMAKRDFVMNKIKSVFINFGYDRIQTPSIEYAETILGKYGEEATKLVYRFKDNGDRDIALRYDQTVPFARVVAANYKELPMPFKRYQIDRVWRADRPAKGRFREFYQCDADVIGTDSLLAEAETVAVIAKVITALGFKDYLIKFNSRRLINSILASLKIAEKDQNDVIRRLDKIDKIGTAGIDKKLLEVISLTGSNKEKLAQLSAYNTDEITEFLRLSYSFGVPEDALVFDPSIARGLDYYTGIIYEVSIPGADIGSVCGGGRYENLCSNFIDQKFSGVGFAFGFDRLVTAMESLGLLKDVSLNSQVLVTYFSPETLTLSLTVLRAIQEAGISAEIYFEPEKLAKQMKYADKKQIPFVVICGPEEAARDEITVKMMKTGKQKVIPANQVTNYFKGYAAA